ncbi:MAG: hypothetical protein VX708_03925, partial [Candidatus Thermoplasmatota archaeon]|nr:hypothetical protein [Candidatus Thermoplasmatota archaeon]
MSEEQTQETESTEEITLAPGLAKALQTAEDNSGDRGRRRGGPDPLASLRTWQPRTRLGRMVMNGQILTYEEALSSGLPIREVEIVDALLPDVTDDVLAVNMIQRMT